MFSARVQPSKRTCRYDDSISCNICNFFNAHGQLAKYTTLLSFKFILRRRRKKVVALISSIENFLENEFWKRFASQVVFILYSLLAFIVQISGTDQLISWGMGGRGGGGVRSGRICKRKNCRAPKGHKKFFAHETL